MIVPSASIVQTCLSVYGTTSFVDVPTKASSRQLLRGHNLSDILQLAPSGGRTLQLCVLPEDALANHRVLVMLVVVVGETSADVGFAAVRAGFVRAIVI